MRWNLSPLLGVGLLHDATRGSNSFAFSYGLQGGYNISRRVSFVMELSGMTTFQDFDGYGKANQLGDNMLTLTAGFSFRLGKVGWKRVVDANPYIRQNDWLIDYANSHNGEYTVFPRNDYSGLNSLRARLKNRDWDGRSPLIDKGAAKSGKKNVRDNADPNSGDDTSVSVGNSSNSSSDGQNNDRSQSASEQSGGYGNAADSDASFTEYLSLIESGDECIGSPIYFFFAFGTNCLTDASQIVNIDELARGAKKYELAITVVGAADSATGTPDINNTLSGARADFIVAELLKRGISADMIYAVSNGGIADYTPVEANRHTRVELHFPPDI